MEPRGRRWTPLLAMGGAVVLAFGLLFAACGDDDNGTVAPTAEDGMTEEPADGDDLSSLSGSIRIDGSSTVFPISQAMAEEFINATDRNVQVDVAVAGTGGGFEVFCRGETQISDASRPIEEDEILACADNDINDIVEIQVAIDALTVMVHPDNDFADCMTVEQLHETFKADGTVTAWSDIDPSWPGDEIEFFVPGTDSGTFDYFVEAIIEGVDENAAHRGDVTASEDDNVLAQGIEGNRNAIGYFGFAYFLGAGQALRAVEVDGGAGCVAPSFEAALDGSYTPLSRPLFIYTTETLLSERPEVREFVRFYLESTDPIVAEVGYVTMPEDLLAEQMAKLTPFLP